MGLIKDVSKKNVWIFNHYATNTYTDRGGRHFEIAQNLIANGYDVSLFCANTLHNSFDAEDLGSLKHKISQVDGIDFVFVKASVYKDNGISRILNMLTFFLNIFHVAKKICRHSSKPDIIYASSVHPLTLVAGIKLAKKFKIPCICEVRDLWPESIVAHGSLKKNSILARLMYMGEKWIYKKAHKLIFTMQGGADYIIQKRWDTANGGPVDISKVHHINNGINLDKFIYNKNHLISDDVDLANESIFKVVYTGSIRMINNIGLLLDAAKLIENDKIRFLIWGSGDELDALKQRCIDENISNVTFKGRVDKSCVPYIVSKADVNVLDMSCCDVYRYGISLNKLFDYLAAGRPIVSCLKCNYDIIEHYNCGFTVEQSPQQFARSIENVYNLPADDYSELVFNANKAAADFDFKVHTQKLIGIIEEM